ncbi:MAG: CDP-alcohol phosphatidyltransferase family protein, partial [Hyphomicrobium sp.]|nr:CDP-alcohol phosphatidyltransferase family protein [Hyphomicrobium sp.]
MLNLPNLLTLSRIAAIPLVVACLWFDRGWMQWAAMCLFVVACVTDWFDGYFARRYHQISRLGRFLDPIADKLLVAATLLMLVYNHALGGNHVIAALVILMREILVS